jgi:hypothetical protein
LGQSADPTAIAVLMHQHGMLDTGNSFQRHTGDSVKTQVKAERCDCVHLERLPLGMSYVAQVEHVQELLARPPLAGDGDEIKAAQLVIDSTGVGNAVANIFDLAGLMPLKITITAGLETTWQSNTSVHVAKTTLISGVDALLHRGVLRFAKALQEAGAMRAELQDFRRSLSAAGRATYSARVGKHDDLVLAVAIAAFWLGLPKPIPTTFGHY